MKPSMLWLLIPLAIAAGSVAMSCASRRQPRTGMVDGKLLPCPGSPNCVSSEEKNGPFSVDPLTFKGAPEVAWESLKRAVQGMGGKIEQEAENYLWATFRTKVFRFVDDLECRMDAANGVIHVRSASRVGYSDLGVNRKRVEALRSGFAREVKRQGGSL